MKPSRAASLQDQLFHIPFHQLTFLTSLPQEVIHFEAVCDQIPRVWLERSSLCVLHDRHEIDTLNTMETASRIIQDQNLTGIVICAKEPFFLHTEPLLLFEECGLPVIQILNGVAQRFFQQGQEEFSSYSQLSEEISCFQEKGFFSMAEELAAFLKTPLLYCDEQFQALWETGEEEALRRARRWINVHYRELSIAVHAQDADGPGSEGEFKPYLLKISGKASHWLIASGALVSWQKRFVDKFTGLASLYFQNEGHMVDILEKVKRHFVYDLLYHKFESQKVMMEHGKIWGWNLEKPHRVLLVDIQLSQDWNGSGQWLLDMVEYLEREKCKFEENIHVVLFEDKIVLLLEDEAARTSEERKRYVIELAQMLEQDLSRQWGDCSFHIGIGKWYQDTTFLNKSYQEAKLALQFGQGWFKDQKVFHYNDLGILRLLMHVHQGILSDFSEDYLSVLMESDQESGTEYMKTLLSYIQFRGRMDETAEALFIHPNTLRNRIKKIEEMLGIDLQDPEEFSNMMVAVKIYFFLNSSF